MKYEGQPWDRQRNEQDKLESAMWYGRFEYYLLLGPERTLIAAYRRWKVVTSGEKGKITKYPGSWHTNYTIWKWKERAELWDAKNRQERMTAEENERKKMIARHIQAGRVLQQIALRKLKILDTATEAQELEPAEARHYLKAGVEIERQARGMPDHLLQITEMTDDELKAQYDQLFGEITNTGDVQSGDDQQGNSHTQGAATGDTAVPSGHDPDLS